MNRKRLACCLLVMFAVATAAASERVVVSPVLPVASGDVLIVKDSSLSAKVGRALLAALVPGPRREGVFFWEADAAISAGNGRVVVVRRPTWPAWVPSVDVRVERERPEAQIPEQPMAVCPRPSGQDSPVYPQFLPNEPTQREAGPTEPLWQRIASAVFLVESIIAVLLLVLLMLRALRLPRSAHMRPMSEPPDLPEASAPRDAAETA